MALPKLNGQPNYTLTIPSTSKRVSYRPYLVKEEKVLMIAFETGDQAAALTAIVDTLKACIKESIDTSKLTTFDIEYMFTQIRSKSVGEKSNILLKCSSCEEKNEVGIEIGSIEVKVPEVNNVIQLTNSISVEMQWPSWDMIIGTNMERKEIEIGFEMIGQCIKSIMTEEERIDTKDVSKAELDEFIESMTTDQFKKVSEFLKNMPALEKDVKFACKACGTQNDITLRGLADFL